MAIYQDLVKYYEKYQFQTWFFYTWCATRSTKCFHCWAYFSFETNMQLVQDVHTYIFRQNLCVFMVIRVFAQICSSMWYRYQTLKKIIPPAIIISHTVCNKLHCAICVHFSAIIFCCACFDGTVWMTIKPIFTADFCHIHALHDRICRML